MKEGSLLPISFLGGSKELGEVPVLSVAGIRVGVGVRAGGAAAPVYPLLHQQVVHGLELTEPPLYLVAYFSYTNLGKE